MDWSEHTYFLKCDHENSVFTLYGLNEDQTMYVPLRKFTQLAAAKIAFRAYNYAQRAAENFAS